MKCAGNPCVSTDFQHIKQYKPSVIDLLSDKTPVYLVFRLLFTCFCLLSQKKENAGTHEYDGIPTLQQENTPVFYLLSGAIRGIPVILPAEFGCPVTFVTCIVYVQM